MTFLVQQQVNKIRIRRTCSKLDLHSKPSHVHRCKTLIKGCNKLLTCITVKLVHSIMRVLDSRCFVINMHVTHVCVADGGKFHQPFNVCQ